MCLSFSSGSSEKQQQQKPPAAAPLPSTTSKGQQTSKEKGPQTTTTSTLMIQQHVYSGVSGAHADSPGLEALGVVPPASTGTPVINKDYLSELQRRIKGYRFLN
jgi:hypothetical protein